LVVATAGMVMVPSLEVVIVGRGTGFLYLRMLFSAWVCSASVQCECVCSAGVGEGVVRW
jgi:hypothetical protein